VRGGGEVPQITLLTFKILYLAIGIKYSKSNTAFDVLLGIDGFVIIAGIKIPLQIKSWGAILRY